MELADTKEIDDCVEDMATPREPQGKLRVRVIEAQRLPSADRNGLSDPFVHVFYPQAARVSTPVMFKTLNPKWFTENIFDFNVVNKRLDVVKFVVWDKDKFKKDFLGQACVPFSVVLASQYPDRPVDLWIDLLNQDGTLVGGKGYMESRGRLRVSLQYTPPRSEELDAHRSASLGASGGSDVNVDVPDKERRKSVLQDFRLRATSMASRHSWTIGESEVEMGKYLTDGTNASVHIGKYRGQDVAIKVLKQVLDPRQMSDFQAEFDMLARIRSPYLVLFYGYATMDDKLAMIFEFCAGGSLFHALKDPKLVLGWDRVLQMTTQVAQGVNTLHKWEPSIVHRDIKSLNFLVDEYYNVKLADFGLSRVAEGEETEATLVKARGSFHYSPPEVYDKQQAYTMKSDVFSMAVVYWEIVNRAITGAYAVPYAEHGLKMDFQVLIKVAKEDMRPTLPPTTPAPLAAYIQQMWIRDPAKRPSSMDVIVNMRRLAIQWLDNAEEWDAVLPNTDVDE